MSEERNNYIRDYREKQDELVKSLKESAQTNMREILSASAREEIRKFLTEAEDTFEVEDVGVDDKDSKEGDKKEDTDVTSVTDEDSDGDVVTDTTVSTEEEDVADPLDSDIEDDLSSFLDADGDYDLTGMGPEEGVKVLKRVGLDNDDEVVVTELENGSIDLKDNAAGTEYIITLPDCCDEEDVVIDLDIDESKDHEEKIYEIVLDTNKGACNEDTNLGYTDNYQSQTAMTTPDNHEPANPRTTYSMDAGVPKGTKKPYAGTTKPSVNGQPYEEEVNEAMTTQEDGAFNRGTGMLHGNTNSKAAVGRNASIGGRKVHGTSQNSYSPTQMESIMRRLNNALKENRELKSLLTPLHQRLQEGVVTVRNVGNFAKLIIENATTKEEKVDILGRFDKVKTEQESNQLYEQISKELKRNGVRNDANGNVGPQLTEATNRNIKHPLYESEEISDVRSFMQRLDKIKNN